MKCKKHEWRFQNYGGLGDDEYYYCIFCLAEAHVYPNGRINIKEREIETK